MDVLWLQKAMTSINPEGIPWNLWRAVIDIWLL